MFMYVTTIALFYSICYVCRRSWISWSDQIKFRFVAMAFNCGAPHPWIVLLITGQCSTD